MAFMQNFDLRSFLLLSGLLEGMCFFFLLTVIRASFPKSIKGVSEWIWACGLSALAAVFLSAYLPISIHITRWLGNTTLLFGLLMMYISLRKFSRVPAKHRLLTALVCVVAGLLFWKDFIDEDYRARVMLVMSANVVLSLACAKTLIDVKTKSLPEYLTLAIFMMQGSLALMRMILVIYGFEDVHFLQSQNPYVKLYITTYFVLLVVLMFGFMLIVSRRLRETLMYLSAYGSDFDLHAREERWRLERALQIAVTNNELVLHYQPRVDVKTGEVIAVEALIRWNHPSRGLIGPDHFIHAAEGRDTILHIGEWVVRQAVDCLNRLQKIRPGIRMSVNASPNQLDQTAFVSYIAQALRNVEFDPKQLELELTEGVVISDPEKAQATMHALKKIGICLSIDDFGTGYSSLSYLKRLPVDCVKIDRSFIKDIPEDQDDVTITKAIIAMGHALGLCVVAEGVETQTQLAFLSNASCDEYQGYLFSEALPERELVALLQRKNAPHAIQPVVRRRKDKAAPRG